VAFFKAGDYESAISAFSQDTSAQAAYNLGLAYFKNGDYAAAQMAFGEAVEKNPNLKDAAKNQQIAQHLMGGEDEFDPNEAQEQQEKGEAQNMENKDMEDLGGGGQEATKKDMEKERKEETVATDVRKAKELEEVPENFEAGEADNSQKVLMRKVDDDPALFLKRKFKHEVKVKGISPKKGLKPW
jgi:Ca-activated chloride channel family protein